MSVDQSDEEAELSEESEAEEPVPEPAKKTKKVEKSATGADVLEGRSVFLRNVPFDADEQVIQGKGLIVHFHRCPRVKTDKVNPL